MQIILIELINRTLCQTAWRLRATPQKCPYQTFLCVEFIIFIKCMYYWKNINNAYVHCSFTSYVLSLSRESSTQHPLLS
jgi:hypothetical protein